MTKKPSTEPLDVLTYEEVTLHLSKTGRKRPIVLVAPAYVGHRHLLQKLMEMKTEMFAKVVYRKCTLLPSIWHVKSSVF